MYMSTDRFLEHVLDEHNERRRRREGEEFVARDMVDLLLQLADDPNLEVPIKRDGVKAFTLAFQMEQDLIVAATDTSAVTLEWATWNSSRSRRSSPRPPRSWTASSAVTAWSRRETSRASPTSRPS